MKVPTTNRNGGSTVNRFMSVFSQILQLFSRLDFEKAVKETKAERHARGFAPWSQFVAMLFCQLGRAKSLREICGGLACYEGKLSHLGITAPRRSTLAYANEHRPWTLHMLLRPIGWCIVFWRRPGCPGWRDTPSGCPCDGSTESGERPTTGRSSRWHLQGLAAVRGNEGNSRKGD